MPRGQETGQFHRNSRHPTPARILFQCAYTAVLSSLLFSPPFFSSPLLNATSPSCFQYVYTLFLTMPRSSPLRSSLLCPPLLSSPILASLPSSPHLSSPLLCSPPLSYPLSSPLFLSSPLLSSLLLTKSIRPHQSQGSAFISAHLTKAASLITLC